MAKKNLILFKMIQLHVPATLITWFICLSIILLKVSISLLVMYRIFFTGLNFSNEVLHTTCIFWVKNAPVYGKNPHSEVASFVDKYVSCSDDVQDIQADLLNLQLHRHAKTCKKKMEKTNTCGFNFPMPPMSETMVLKPLAKENIDKKRA